MSLYLFTSLLVNGLAMGVIYAMLGMGLILLIRAVGVMNFAQGDLLAFGAYICACLVIDFKLPLYFMIPVALLCFMVLGAIFMLSVYWPLRKASYPAATIIATMGASIALKEGALLIWGRYPRTMSSIITTAEGKSAVIRLGEVTLQWQYVLTIFVGVILMLLIFALFEKSYAGMIMQAASQDQYAANLLGIPTFITIILTYMIVVALASIGGFMISPIFLVTTSLSTLQLRAFAGVVIGGFGNIKGAIIGALIVGIVESFSSVQFSAYKDVTVFLLLLIFLLFRPQGLFGERISDKA